MNDSGKLANDLAEYWKEKGMTPGKGGKKDERKVLIVCGGPKQANYYAHLNGWENWQYVSSIITFHGQRDIRIVYCGTWRWRKDLNRIIEVADDMFKRGYAIITTMSEK